MPLPSHEVEVQLLAYAVPSSEKKALYAKLEALASPVGQDSVDALEALGARFNPAELRTQRAHLPLVAGALQGPFERMLSRIASRPYLIDEGRQPFRTRSPGVQALIRGLAVRNTFWLRARYNQPIEWWAVWSGYLERQYMVEPILEAMLASEIDAGNLEVFRTLVDSVEGRHPIGMISRTGIRALLTAGRTDGWAVVERLLLHAGLAEGLRQTIVESLDEVHPQVFARFVRLIIEHNLLRFSSVRRAFMVWLPELIDEGKHRSAENVLSRLLEFLNDPSIPPILEFNDVYLRLWADAFVEADDAIRRAEALWAHPQPEVRRAVVKIAASTRLSSGDPLLLKALQQDDLTVAQFAIKGLSSRGKDVRAIPFEPHLRALAHRWPAKPGPELEVDRQSVWAVAAQCAPPAALAHYFQHITELDSFDRFWLARRITEIADAAERRRAIFTCIADRSTQVRDIGFEELERAPVSAHEAPELEALLTRRSGELRKSILVALSAQAKPLAAQSAARLGASKNELQRQAGQELAEKLNPPPAPPRTRGADDTKSRFGLIVPSELTYADKPAPLPGGTLFTPGALQILTAIDNYLFGRRDEMTLAIGPAGGKEQIAIGDLLGHRIWSGLRYSSTDVDEEALLPLHHEFMDWCQRTFPNLEARSGDWIRAELISSFASDGEHRWIEDVESEFAKQVRVRPRYLSTIGNLLKVFALRAPLVPTAYLDVVQHLIATTADDRYEFEQNYSYTEERSWRSGRVLDRCMDRAESQIHKFGPEDTRRAVLLWRFFDEPKGRMARDAALQAYENAERLRFRHTMHVGNKRYRLDVPPRCTMPMALVSHALRYGACTDSDGIDAIAHALRDATKSWDQWSPRARTLTQRFVDRIVEIECRRGELPTEASRFVGEISGCLWLRHVVHILNAGGVATRGYVGDGEVRKDVLGHLLSRSRPAAEESPEQCGAAFANLKVKPERLVELAMVAPRWARAVELALGWGPLEDAVWWFRAHTRDSDWRAEESENQWQSGQISERTRLTAEQLADGKCDPDWFRRVRSSFTDARWKVIQKSAKFASSGTAHGRAVTYGLAISGELKPETIVEQIRAKRNQNSVRALGLAPLTDPSGAELRDRYHLLQGFLVESRQFGSARQASEKRAVEIALGNLAATAGYPDSLRLSWQLESEAAQDLKGAGKVVTIQDVDIRLSFDALGQPIIDVAKNGMAMKDIPAALKKHPEVKELLERRTVLRKQLSRMRLSLEGAMNEGDSFTASELRALMDHPGLRPLLRNLVFIGESGACDFPDEQGSVGAETGKLRVAHPYDLLRHGDWPEWQARVFREERVQPFKQVFRELYVRTAAEDSQNEVTRFAGHQVIPTRALAILAKRGWIARYEDGVSKTNYNHSIVARLSLEAVGYSPADIEGLPLEGLTFTRVGSDDPLPLTEVPPVLFSETLRDLDLIVSVASAVGHDPEATESTVEMRRNVVAQTARLLGLDNVSFIPRHVAIQGALAEYTINLGSGTVHQRARGELVIVAVRQPQRGRLFLPFVDDDPRTAEIVSKTILLARDSEIKDPSILGQIIVGRR
ncbi:MAG: DUF5724 domain-containing protein [Fimbriimonadaceae bacterium]|nr:DUF5724 domain-containing protein [Fimbriimonadaceae bacterium]